MGIIAWIVLGLGAGLLANMLIPGRRQQGLILTCLIGIAGALLGGWAATKIFHLHHALQGFFNALYVAHRHRRRSRSSLLSTHGRSFARGRAARHSNLCLTTSRSRRSMAPRSERLGLALI